MAESLEYPDRWDFLPKQRKFEGRVKFKEASTMDYIQLRQLFARYGSRQPSPKAWDRWLKASGYLVLIAVRNGRNIVGALVTRHTQGENEVLAYAFLPSHVARFDVRSQLLMYAQYEMPEYETSIQVAENDVDFQKELKRLGATANNEYLFRFRRVVTFRSRRSSTPEPAAGGPDKDAPERNDD